MTDDVESETTEARTCLLAVLVVITTIALLTAGVTTPARPPVALIAGSVAVVSGALSLVVARKRGNLVGWYAMTLGVMILRALSGE
jgi:hypothetical protein